MKNEVTVFQNEQFGQVRTIDENGKIYFCGKDAAIALGYANTKDALARHCKQYGVVKRDLIDNMGRKQIAAFIDESNLYRLITHSKLPEAEKFENWVFDEVLPSIRKTGKYEMKPSDDLKAKRVETAQANANVRKASLLLKIADSTKTQYKEVLQAHVTKLLTGEFLLPLPEVNELTYSAGEIAERLGTTACKIGHLANTHGMKTEYYGKWFYDKAPHSNKQVETFRYYEKAVEVFRKLLEVAA